jgi:hypothetical protein
MLQISCLMSKGLIGYRPNEMLHASGNEAHANGPLRSGVQQSYPKTFVSSHIWKSNFQFSRIVGNLQRDSVPYRMTDGELSWIQAPL